MFLSDQSVKQGALQTGISDVHGTLFAWCSTDGMTDFTCRGTHLCTVHPNFTRHHSMMIMLSWACVLLQMHILEWLSEFMC